MVSVFQLYIRENPGRLHERNTTVTFDALREAFPCSGR
ncbi:hypothetical protein [Algiphilus sp.]